MGYEGKEYNLECKGEEYNLGYRVSIIWDIRVRNIIWGMRVRGIILSIRVRSIICEDGQVSHVIMLPVPQKPVPLAVSCSAQHPWTALVYHTSWSTQCCVDPSSFLLETLSSRCLHAH